jgi:hypothetical protein
VGKFEPGHPKVGGIKEGDKHKTTKTFQSIVNNMLNGETERIAPAFEAVYKKDKFKYLMLIEKFMSYIAPKLSNTSLTGKDGEPLFNNTLNLILHDAGTEIRTEEPGDTPEQEAV